jgi:hypothetical protein
MDDTEFVLSFIEVDSKGKISGSPGDMEVPQFARDNLILLVVSKATELPMIKLPA